MKFGIVVFPGTWSDGDCFYVVREILGQDAVYIWHKERDLRGAQCIILPGGFSYGDYLRPGAIARFSPVMGEVVRFAEAGGLVIGICNGFQILCEAGLLPGALIRNSHLQYRCQWTHLKVENTSLPFTCACEEKRVLRIPISHYEGNYFADPETLRVLEEEKRVVFRYATPEGEATPEANPNGSVNNIAGIVNERGNVLGMMPHPERACEDILGSSDGLLIFRSVLKWLGEIM